MIVALFSYRYDAALVPALLENLCPLVHAWISWDDRQATASLSAEPDRRDMLLAAARRIGADWILAIDPDERLETGLRDSIRAMTAPGIQTIWTFTLREMYGPDQYRVDGVWGRKTQSRLFPCAIAQTAAGAALHGHWFANTSGLVLQKSGYDLYHLRMATQARRQHRRDTYAAADPERRHQAIGYDYLADDRGMVLEPIPVGRGFLPPHSEDGALWAPTITAIGTPGPDPTRSRLLYVQTSLRHQGQRAAAFVLRDMVAADPEDADLLAVAAHLHLEAGDHALVDECVALLASHNLALNYGLSVQARSLAQRQDRAGAAAVLAAALRTCKANRYLTDLARGLPHPPGDMAGPDANWRRWVSGSARLHRGSRVAQADLAVVVIGYRAPADLRAAVQSLIDQDTGAEIIVVNSGGGDATARLAGLLDHVVLIDIRARLFVGAARNIGIDASRAPYVAFLASDCLAAPGWVRNRIARHAAGAQMVSTPVVPQDPRNIYSRAANALLHWRRRPDLDPAAVVHYGRSYARWLFASYGYFAPGLRAAEDSEFHSRIPGNIPPVWAPDVLTRHRYPTRFVPFLRDCVTRAIRRAACPPFSSFVAPPAVWRQVLRLCLIRHKAVLADVWQQQGFGWQGLSVWALLKLALGLDLAGLAIGYRRLARNGGADRPGHLQDPGPQDAARILILHQNWRRAVQQAKALVGRKTPEDDIRARAILTAIVQIAPAETAPILMLCDLLVRQGLPKAALSAAEDALIAVPGNAHVWSKASQLAHLLGRADMAILYGQGALARAPANTTAHLTLEQIYRDLGKLYLARRRSASRKALQDTTLP